MWVFPTWFPTGFIIPVLHVRNLTCAQMQKLADSTVYTWELELGSTIRIQALDLHIGLSVLDTKEKKRS